MSDIDPKDRSPVERWGRAFLLMAVAVCCSVFAAIGAMAVADVLVGSPSAAVRMEDDPEQAENPRTYPSPYVAQAPQDIVPLVLPRSVPAHGAPTPPAVPLVTPAAPAPVAPAAPAPVAAPAVVRPTPALAPPAPLRPTAVPAAAPAPAVLPASGPPAASAPAVAVPAAPPQPVPSTVMTAPTAIPMAPASSFLALQAHQRTEQVDLSGGRRLRLVSLNAAVNHWFLLYRDGTEFAPVHLENPRPLEQTLAVTAEGLVVTSARGREICPVFDSQGRDPFRDLQAPVTPYCQGQLLVLSQRGGWRTRQEAVVALLRSTGDLGERAIDLYKSTLGRDADLEVAQLERGVASDGDASGMPPSARLDAARRGARLTRGRLGVPTAGEGALEAGRWYPVVRTPGVAVSVMAANLVPQDLLTSFSDRVAPLDEVEAPAVVRLVAFDLDRMTVDFRLGTNHPAVEWSRRYEGAKPGPGPDGFGSVAPLARVGMVRPAELERLVGAFAAGFKREHGAFRAGPFATANSGSHYGFVEAGVVLSRLQPGLATLFGTVDGRIELRVWTPQDANLLPRLRFARQNGVPIIQEGDPHPFVRQWGSGNWSGALNPSGAGGVLRSLRSGACLLPDGERRWLVYAQFSAATPSAMARVFQAYGCREAMHLDMNSPDLTYAAVYRGDGQGGVVAAHVDTAMAQSDPAGGLKFVSANDNRDFFVILRR